MSVSKYIIYSRSFPFFKLKKFQTRETEMYFLILQWSLPYTLVIEQFQEVHIGFILALLWYYIELMKPFLVVTMIMTPICFIALWDQLLEQEKKKKSTIKRFKLCDITTNNWYIVDEYIITKVHWKRNRNLFLYWFLVATSLKQTFKLLLLSAALIYSNKDYS